MGFDILKAFAISSILSGCVLSDLLRITKTFPRASQILGKKYWLTRLPIWSKKNVYLEIDPVPA
jgi:hypothetical protein